jgi:predicted metal-binding membrane protein
MTSWEIMLAAMMSPLLAGPMRFICDRSFACRRARELTFFVVGYIAIWTVCGFALQWFAQGLNETFPAIAALASVGVMALGWEISPIKQVCLNQCHRSSDLRAFAYTADVDALRFGLVHGAACVGSCSVLMLLVLVVPFGHVGAMGTVAVWIFGERLEQPRQPLWRMRGPLRAARAIAAQARVLSLGVSRHHL